MNLAEYRQHVEAIPYGKRLPAALYVFRDEGASLGEKLDALLTRVAAACGADARHNVIKFRLDELKVSFLAYPEFMTDPHPELPCSNGAGGGNGLQPFAFLWEK